MLSHIFPSFFPVDLSPAVLVELVARIHSTRLKLAMADAIFRNLCCRNGFTLGDEPLSLKKMVCIFSVCLFDCLIDMVCLVSDADFQSRMKANVMLVLCSLLLFCTFCSFSENLFKINLSTIVLFFLNDLFCSLQCTIILS